LIYLFIALISLLINQQSVRIQKNPKDQHETAKAWEMKDWYLKETIIEIFKL